MPRWVFTKHLRSVISGLLGLAKTQALKKKMGWNSKYLHYTIGVSSMSMQVQATHMQIVQSRGLRQIHQVIWRRLKLADCAFCYPESPFLQECVKMSKWHVWCALDCNAILNILSVLVQTLCLLTSGSRVHTVKRADLEQEQASWPPSAKHHGCRLIMWFCTVSRSTGKIRSLTDSCSYSILAFLWKPASCHGRGQKRWWNRALGFFFHLHVNMRDECFRVFRAPLALPVFSCCHVFFCHLRRKPKAFMFF